MDQKKLDLVNQLLDERDQRRTLENNSIVKLLSGIIDMTATEKLTDDVSALTDKLMEVSLQAPQLHGEALESIKNISSEMENMEFRAAQYATQLNDALKSQMSENNQSNVKLIESLKAQNTAIRKQIAETNGKLSSIQLRHGKTPVKGVDYTDGKDGEDGIGISSIKITDGSLLVTLTDGTEKNAGKLPTSKNGGKYFRSPYEYATEYGYAGTESEFYEALANPGGGGGTWGSITGTLSEQTDLQEVLNAKQATLESGVSIKTINGDSVLGSGDITVAANKTRKQMFFENDFMYNNSQSFSPWFGNAISSGTLAAVNGEANHPGLIQFSSSTTTNSGYYVLMNPVSLLISGDETSEFVFKTPTSIASTATIRFNCQDALTYAAPTDGIWINLANTTLTGRTASNGSASTTASSYTVSANTWYRATIELNADATLATFKLFSDNSDTPLWTDTLSTNIPTGSGRNTGHGVLATSSGTSAVPLIIMDYMNLKIDRELAR